MKQYFSLRRVNPFLGTVAVVKTADGRALSLDGRQWQLQVLAHAPRGLWSGGGEQATTQYFRFGLWSQAHGLGRVPLNPVLDVGHMVRSVEELIEQVRAALGNLPFPLAPEVELWLLDRERLPLALLATAPEGEDLGGFSASTWSAGGRGERGFVSQVLAEKGLPERQPDGGRPHAEALERLIQGAAGRWLNRQWFRRAEDGSGTGLAHGVDQTLAGRRLSASCFPTGPLRTVWPGEEDRRLVGDYIAWLAPYLLTLPGLDRAERSGLEGRAVEHALLTDSLCPLYPEVVHRDLLNRARVEARLRRARADT